MSKCSDCGHELQQIYVIDARGAQSYQLGFEYTTEPPKKSFFDILKNVAGTIHAFMCPNCKKVHFYAYEGQQAQSV